MNLINNFEAMLEKGQDNSLLRYSLGNEYFKLGDNTKALQHLEQALEQQPDYSAAWKLYGKVLADSDRVQDAKQAFRKGIDIAEANGDKQAVREMEVFLKRLEKLA